MSICLVALVVFAVLGIFSGKYRRWTMEAFQCVARRLTLRPCETGFNQRVRAKITAKLMKKSTRTARFTNKHFEAISWIFTILLFLSLFYTTYSFYNITVYGSCDLSDYCIFNSGNNAICGCTNNDCNVNMTSSLNCAGENCNCTTPTGVYEQ